MAKFGLNESRPRSRNKMHSLYNILQDLDTAKIHYSLARYREGYVTIHVTIVGQRIEIDVDSEGNIETSIFEGSEEVESGIEIKTMHR